MSLSEAQKPSRDALTKAKGKTISDFEFAEESPQPDAHESEFIVIHFTDGTSVTIRIASNAENVAMHHEGMKPSEFDADFDVSFQDKS